APPIPPLKVQTSPDIVVRSRAKRALFLSVHQYWSPSHTSARPRPGHQSQAAPGSDTRNSAHLAARFGAPPGMVRHSPPPYSRPEPCAPGPLGAKSAPRATKFAVDLHFD